MDTQQLRKRLFDLSLDMNRKNGLDWSHDNEEHEIRHLKMTIRHVPAHMLPGLVADLEACEERNGGE